MQTKTSYIPYCALYVFQIIQFFIIVTDVRRENGKLCLLCQDDFSNTFILIPDEWSEMHKTDEMMTDGHHLRMINN